MTRKLPVYLVLDCSESMAGEPLKAVESGVQAMTAQLRADPYALETAWLGIITFSRTAKVMVPLTEMPRFLMPPLVMGSGTALGAAITTLEGCLATDVVRSSPERKGDYKPVIFFLTDGDPTDDWEAKADRFKREFSDRRATVVVVVCGDDASSGKMRRLSDQVILARDLDANTLKSLFRWVSASVATASQAVDGKREIVFEKGAGLTLATPSDDARRVEPNRYLFLHARCVRDRTVYIMRYRKKGAGASAPYEAVASHPVTAFEEDPSGAPSGLSISTDRLEGSSPCPGCANPFWAMCSCGRVHCCPALDEDSVTLTCPWCRKTGDYSEYDFDVGRGSG
jgi:uncharacterized protein YegL